MEGTVTGNWHTPCVATESKPDPVEVVLDESVTQALGLLASVDGDLRVGETPEYVFRLLLLRAGALHTRNGFRASDASPMAVVPEGAEVLCTDGIEARLEDVVFRTAVGFVHTQSLYGHLMVNVAARTSREADSLLAELLANCPETERPTARVSSRAWVKQGELATMMRRLRVLRWLCPCHGR